MSHKKRKALNHAVSPENQQLTSDSHHEIAGENGPTEKDGKVKSLSRFEWITLVLSILAVSVSVASAYYARGQREMMRVEMQLDQRAWLGFFDETIEPARNDKATFYKLRLTVKNTGKTPAQAVQVEGIETPRLRTPPTWEEIERNWDATFEDPDTGTTLKDYIPHFPTDPRTGDLESINKTQSDILPPGATTSWEYAIFSRTDSKPHRLGGYFLVRVRYFDGFSKQNRATKLCFMETMDDAVQHCPSGNSMD
jgi:hypothetical protein